MITFCLHSGIGLPITRASADMDLPALPAMRCDAPSHVEGLETERTSLRAELETTLAQLRIKERELDNAESVAYRATVLTDEPPPRGGVILA